MSYQEYWHGDVWMVKSFREADKLRQERENAGYWMQGMYIYEAFAAVLKNAFSKKGSTPAKYPEKPYDIFPEEKTEDQKLQEEEQERIKAKLYMQNMVRAGRSWGK